MLHPGTKRAKPLPVALIDTRMLMAIMEQCRRECIHLSIKTAIRSPAYKAAHDVTGAIDGLAEVLTGRRDYFHLPAHTADTSYKR